MSNLQKLEAGGFFDFLQFKKKLNIIYNSDDIQFVMNNYLVVATKDVLILRENYSKPNFLSYEIPIENSWKDMIYEKNIYDSNKNKYSETYNFYNKNGLHFRVSTNINAGTFELFYKDVFTLFRIKLPREVATTIILLIKHINLYKKF
jgi:hypothetical protein